MLLGNDVVPSLSSLYTMPDLVDVARVDPSSCRIRPVSESSTRETETVTCVTLEASRCRPSQCQSQSRNSLVCDNPISQRKPAMAVSPVLKSGRTRRKRKAREPWILIIKTPQPTWLIPPSFTAAIKSTKAYRVGDQRVSEAIEKQ